MQVEIADDEAAVLLGALNTLLTVAPAVGLQATQKMAMLAAKLIAVLPKPAAGKDGATNGGQEAAGKQGTAEAVKARKGAKHPEEGVAHMTPKRDAKGKFVKGKAKPAKKGAEPIWPAKKGK